MEFDDALSDRIFGINGARHALRFSGEAER
jgi:hypothetical protein